jgi:NADH-quinone oxidoreductase subunit K
VIHLAGPYVVAALLVGIGVFGILARRNAVLVLVGVELVIGGGTLLLVASGLAHRVASTGGSALRHFVIPIAAAEVVVALAVILLVHRQRGGIDLTEGSGR